MNDGELYIVYLEQKVKALEAQVKLAMDSVYHREAVIRQLKAEITMLGVKLRNQQ